MAELSKLAPIVLKWEGGFGEVYDLEHDLGGATKAGVTLATYQTYKNNPNLTAADLNKMTKREWNSIFRNLVWNPLKGDKINNQSVANIFVDWAWGSGQGNAVPRTKKALGYEIDKNYKVKDEFINFINSGNSYEIFHKIKQARLDHFDAIVKSNPTQKKWINGWRNRVNSFVYEGDDKPEEKKEEKKDNSTNSTPNYTWNSNTPSAPQKNEDKKDTNNICRIVVDPNIKSKIKLDELSLPTPSTNDSISNSQNNIINKVGLIAPLICINNVYLERNEISYLEINCTNFLPTISLIIEPKSISLLTTNAIKDGDIISVFIKTSNDTIKALRCDFLITSNKVNGYEINNPNCETTIKLLGELFIPKIHASNENIYTCNTSKEAMKDICKKLGIGFAFNDTDDTTDKQLWFCPKKDLLEHIEDITSHIWKDEQSFFKTWVDIYYNLNFINVNKMLDSNSDNIDLTINNIIRMAQNESPIKTSQNDANAQMKILTNGEMSKHTSFSIFDITPVNNSSNVTNTIGSKIKNAMFIHNQNNYNKGEEPYIILDNVQMYDPNKTNDYMVLRGRSKYIEDETNTDTPHENYNIEDTNTRTIWRGIQYTISDEDKEISSNDWSGNVNLNYNRAETHNVINNMELEKMYLKVLVPGACLQVMRGEKIPIIVYYKDELSIMSNNSSNDELANVNKLYSGYFFVDGYKIIYSENDAEDNMLTNFRTEFILKRREWPIPVDYAKEK